MACSAMAETCAAPSGRKPFSFGMDPKTLAFVVVPILAVMPLATFLILPLLWRALGSSLGWYLRRKTDGRRSHILQLVEADEKKHEDEIGKRKNSEEDDEWERVDAYALGSSKNGEKADKEWDGIAGFFHPFW